MDTFAVIGLGRFGRRLATLLTESGAEVIAIDMRMDRIEAIRDRVTTAVCLDSTNEQALRAQGVDKVDVAVVGVGTDFEASLLTTVILKQLGVPRVISRATNSIRAKILSRIDADDIVNPERESAERWGERLLEPRIRDRIALAKGHSLVQVSAPSNFHNKTLAQLDIGKKHKVLVVAIRRADLNETIISPPRPETPIEPGDVLTLIGADTAIEAFPHD